MIEVLKNEDFTTPTPDTRVALVIPRAFHRVAAGSLALQESSFQQALTITYAKYCLDDPIIPPLIKNVPQRGTGAGRGVTWYTKQEQHKRLKHLAVHYDLGLNIMFVSALVHYLKDEPEIKSYLKKNNFDIFADPEQAKAHYYRS